MALYLLNREVVKIFVATTKVESIYTQNKSAWPPEYSLDLQYEWQDGSEGVPGSWALTSLGYCTDTKITVPAVHSGPDGDGELRVGPVTVIKTNAFAHGLSGLINVASIEEIILPNSIKTIESESFYYESKSGAFSCSNLKSLTIPESVTRIDFGAFYGCSGLTSITLPFVGTDANSNYPINDSSVEFNTSTLFGSVFYFPGTTIPEGWTEIKQTLVPSVEADDDATHTYYLPENLTSVSIRGPERCARKICYKAFSNCSQLEEINIGSGIEIIDNAIFAGCTKLTKLTLPFVGRERFPIGESPATVFGYVFESITDVPKEAYTPAEAPFDSVAQYYNSLDLTVTHKYAIPRTLTTIVIQGGNLSCGAFSNLVFLKNLDLSSCTSLKKIPTRAFYNCHHLGTQFLLNKDKEGPNPGLILPSCGDDDDCGLIEEFGIESFSFVGTQISNVDPVKNPNNSSGLDNCLNLSKFSKLAVIKKRAFGGCDALQGIRLPESAPEPGLIIEEQAFQGLSESKYSIITDAVFYIGEKAFAGSLRNKLCFKQSQEEATTKIRFAPNWNFVRTINKGTEDEKDIYYNDVEDIYYDVENICRHDEYDGQVTSYSYEFIIWKNSEQEFIAALINTRAYAYDDKEYGAIEVPSEVEIGGYKITVKEIARYAFENCFYGAEGKRTVSLPETIAVIKPNAFVNLYNLQILDLSKLALTTLKEDSGLPIWNFVASGTKLYVGPQTPEIALNVLDKLLDVLPYTTSHSSADKKTTITVYYLAYLDTDSNEAVPFCICRGKTTSGSGVDVTILADDIPDSVTSISSRAFRDCSSLSEIIIPNSVTSIGNYAFDFCSSLTSVTIGKGVTSIGDWAFSGCSSLNKVNFTGTIDQWAQIEFADSTSNPTYYTNDLYIKNKLVTEVTKVNLATATKVSDYAFEDCSSLTEIVIPNSVTSIGYSAFNNCSGLTSITIPDSVTSIGSFAFSGCDSLTEIVIPDSVTSIGNYTFAWCGNLTSVTIGNGVSSIGSHAFRDCEKLTYTTEGNLKYLGNNNRYLYLAGTTTTDITSTTINNNCKLIGSYAFKDCSKLESVTMGKNVTSIDYSAFEDCSKLESVYITDIAAWCKISGLHNLMQYGTKSKELYLTNEPDEPVKELTIPRDVTSIGNYAFYSCSGLTSVVIRDSITSIGERAFYNCDGLTSIEIPNSVTTIGSSAFDDCGSLTSVTIGNGVISIGDSAFYSCNSLASIEIPNSVTSIGNYAFQDCSSLTKVVIPNSVTSIGDNAFSGCSSLLEIVLPNSVTSLGNWVFEGCDSLTSIEIPNSVTTIGSYAFQSCDGLKRVTIGNSVTSIGSFAFAFCVSLTSVSIGNSVTSIGDYAFWNCSKLTSASIGNSVTSIGKYAFWECESLSSVIWPSAVGNAYANNWALIKFANEYANPLYYAKAPSRLDLLGLPTKIEELKLNPPAIQDFAFINCSIPSITIGGTTSTIGSSAFCGETINNLLESRITSLTLSEGLRTIGTSAFGNQSIAKINLPRSLNTVGAYAFGNYNTSTNNTSTELALTISNPFTQFGKEAISISGSTDTLNVYYGGTWQAWQTLASKNKNAGENGGCLTNVNVKVKCTCADSSVTYVYESKSWNKGPVTWLPQFAPFALDLSTPNPPRGVAIGEIEESGQTTGYIIYPDPSGPSEQAEYLVSSVENANSLELNLQFGNTDGNTASWPNLLRVSIPAFAPENISALTKFFENSPRLTEIIYSYKENKATLDGAILGTTKWGSLGNSAEWTTIGNQVGTFENEPVKIKIIKTGETGEQQELEVKIGDFKVYKNINGSALVNFMPTADSEIDWSQIDWPQQLEVKVPDTVSKINQNALNNLYSIAKSETIKIILPKDLKIIKQDNFHEMENYPKFDVYYMGTPEDWQAIYIGPWNSGLFPASDIYYYSEEKPTDFNTFKYWHYAESVVTPWTEASCAHDTRITQEAKAATCTETGLTEGVICSDCKEILIAQEEIPALGHNYTAVVTAPTCTTQGYTTYTCSICEHSYEDNSVSELKHTEVVDSAVDPTCAETGLTEGKHCSVCGTVIVAQEVIPALGHTEVIDEAVAPTYTTTGLTEGKHCGVCGTVIVAQEVIPALSHNYTAVVTAPTCTEQGYTTYTCKECGDTYVSNYIEARGHTHSEWIVDKEATYESTGHKYKECTVCGKVLEESEIPKLTHTHTYESVVTKPTCTKRGYTTYTCKECGDTYIDDYVPALGHDTENGSWESNDTHHWHVCDTCEGEYDREQHFSQNANWIFNESDHWKVCDTCNKEYSKNPHSFLEREASATREDWTFYENNETVPVFNTKVKSSCLVCGYVAEEDTEYALHRPSFSDPELLNDEYVSAEGACDESYFEWESAYEAGDGCCAANLTKIELNNYLDQDLDAGVVLPPFISYETDFESSDLVFFNQAFGNGGNPVFSASLSSNYIELPSCIKTIKSGALYNWQPRDGEGRIYLGPLVSEIEHDCFNPDNLSNLKIYYDGTWDDWVANIVNKEGLAGLSNYSVICYSKDQPTTFSSNESEVGYDYWCWASYDLSGDSPTANPYRFYTPTEEVAGQICYRPLSWRARLEEEEEMIPQTGTQYFDLQLDDYKKAHFEVSTESESTDLVASIYNAAEWGENSPIYKACNQGLQILVTNKNGEHPVKLVREPNTGLTGLRIYEGDTITIQAPSGYYLTYVAVNCAYNVEPHGSFSYKLSNSDDGHLFNGGTMASWSAESADTTQDWTSINEIKLTYEAGTSLTTIILSIGVELKEANVAA